MKVNRFEEAREMCKREFGKTLVPKDKVADGDNATGLKLRGMWFMVYDFLRDYGILEPEDTWYSFDKNLSGVRCTGKADYNCQFLENIPISTSDEFDKVFSFGACKCCEELVLMSVWDLENDTELGWIMLN